MYDNAWSEFSYTWFHIIAPNKPPTVTATNKTIFSSSELVVGNAIASDSDGTVVRIEAALNGNWNYVVQDYGLNFGSDLPIGYHTIQYRAVDNEGLTSDIVTSRIQIVGSPPTVTATNKTTFSSTEKVVGNATASDSDGTVVRIEAALNGHWNWVVQDYGLNFGRDLPVGNHTLQYRAVDNDGLVSEIVTSDIVIIGSPPTVTATNKTSFTSSELVVGNATANDSDGTVIRIEAALNGHWNYVVQDYGLNFGSDLPVGNHTLQYRAVDDDGLVSDVVTSKIEIIGSPPAVTATNKTTFSDTEIVVGNATASDSDGTVVRIEAALNGHWNYVVQDYGLNFGSDLPIGKHTIQYRAIDDDGLASEVETSDIVIIGPQLLEPNSISAVIDVEDINIKNTVYVSWTANSSTDIDYVLEQSNNGTLWEQVYRGKISNKKFLQLESSAEKHKYSYRVKTCYVETSSCSQYKQSLPISLKNRNKAAWIEKYDSIMKPRNYSGYNTSGEISWGDGPYLSSLLNIRH